MISHALKYDAIKFPLAKPQYFPLYQDCPDMIFYPAECITAGTKHFTVRHIDPLEIPLVNNTETTAISPAFSDQSLYVQTAELFIDYTEPSASLNSHVESSVFSFPVNPGNCIYRYLIVDYSGEVSAREANWSPTGLTRFEVPIFSTWDDVVWLHENYYYYRIDSENNLYCKAVKEYGSISGDVCSEGLLPHYGSLPLPAPPEPVLCSLSAYKPETTEIDDTCTACAGSGHYDWHENGAGARKCPVCWGSDPDCDYCDGTGYDPNVDNTCPICTGTGVDPVITLHGVYSNIATANNWDEYNSYKQLGFGFSITALMSGVPLDDSWTFGLTSNRDPSEPVPDTYAVVNPLPDKKSYYGDPIVIDLFSYSGLYQINPVASIKLIFVIHNQGSISAFINKITLTNELPT